MENKCNDLAGAAGHLPDAPGASGLSLFDLIPATLVWLVFGVAIALDYRIPDTRDIAIPPIPAEPFIRAADPSIGVQPEDDQQGERRNGDGADPAGLTGRAGGR